MDNACRIGCTCSIECEEATALAYAKRRARARNVQERALSGLRELHAEQSQVIDSLRGRVEP